jgi:hypothetical protein
MRDLAVLLLHLLATVTRLAGPGGARSVVAESVLVKHQFLILNRSRRRSPNLRPADRVVAGPFAIFMRPGRLIRSAIVWVSNSSSRSDWELDEVPAVTDPAHMIQVRRDHGVSTVDG